MGTPIKTPIIGANCGHWDPVDETPIAVYALFWDVKKGDRGFAREPPNGHLFRLEQKPLLPCAWQYDNAAFDWEVNVSLQANNISMDLRESVADNRIYFIETLVYPPWNEYDLFTNDYQTEINNYGYGGYCVMFWLQNIAAHAELLGLFNAPDLMMEFFFVSTTEFVIKFCSLTLRTNIKLKISL